MIIDLTDSSEKAQIEVLELSKTPCIFSSSAVYNLSNQNGTIKDSVLDSIVSIADTRTSLNHWSEQ